MTPLMKKGASKYIMEDDLPDLLPEDAATELSDDLKKALDKQYVLYFFLSNHTNWHQVDEMEKSIFGEGYLLLMGSHIFWLCV